MTKNIGKTCSRCWIFLALPADLQKKASVMKKFEAICSEMSRLSAAADPMMSFSLMCASRGMSRREADEMFYRELGMSGEEVLEAFQSTSDHF